MVETIQSAGTTSIAEASDGMSGYGARDAVGDRVLGLARQVLGLPETAALPLNKPVNELGMSSLKLINLMLAIEAEFDLAIPRRDITPENFDTLGHIEALVTRLVT